MDNLLLLTVFGVLALYFYSNMSIYKNLYIKIKEEKDLCVDAKSNQDKSIIKYENQLQSAIITIKDTEDSINKLREEMQTLKIQNNDLKHRNQLLQDRVDELYSSVGII